MLRHLWAIVCNGIVEGKDELVTWPLKEYLQFGKTVGLLLRLTKSITYLTWRLLKNIVINQNTSMERASRTYDAQRGHLKNVSFHIYAMKEPDYVLSLMSTYGTNK